MERVPEPELMEEKEQVISYDEADFSEGEVNLINQINQEAKILIDQTIESFQTIYSDNCRVYIRPSGTEPVIRILVEADNHKKVCSLSSEIKNKLFLEINKIIN